MNKSTQTHCKASLSARDTDFEPSCLWRISTFWGSFPSEFWTNHIRTFAYERIWISLSSVPEFPTPISTGMYNHTQIALLLSSNIFEICFCWLTNGIFSEFRWDQVWNELLLFPIKIPQFQFHPLRYHSPHVTNKIH